MERSNIMTVEQFVRENYRINEETANIIRTYNTLVMHIVHNAVNDKMLQLDNMDNLNETNNSLGSIKYHIVDLQSKILEELN